MFEHRLPDHVIVQQNAEDQRKRLLVNTIALVKETKSVGVFLMNGWEITGVASYDKDRQMVRIGDFGIPIGDVKEIKNI